MDVKICGLCSKDMIDVAIDAGADHIGFVHFAKSPRHLALSEIKDLGAHADKRATRWVVLARPDNDCLSACAALLPHIDGLQIHGAVDEAYLLTLKADHPELLIMRAHSVASRDEVRLAQQVLGADKFLFDAKPQPGDKLPGGNGVAFDWAIMDALEDTALAGQSWFLAGGLTPENVKEAIRQSGAPAVDVSSGVESAPGVKDPVRIAEFVKAAKSL